MVIHSDKISDKVPESSMEKIFPSQCEVFKDKLEEIAPVLRNMDTDSLQQISNESDTLIRKTEN